MRILKKHLQAQLQTAASTNTSLQRDVNRLATDVTRLTNQVAWMKQLIQQQADIMLAGAKEGSFPRR